MKRILTVSLIIVLNGQLFAIYPGARNKPSWWYNLPRREQVRYDEAWLKNQARQEQHVTMVARGAIERNNLEILKAVYSSLAPGNHHIKSQVRAAIENHPDYHGEEY